LQGQTPEAQRRREGDTLYIQCPYALWGVEREIKYWCLLKDGRYQSVLCTYSGSQNKDKRIQIKDNTTNKTVSITMTDLKAEDSGTYFCAYHNYQYGISTYIPIRMISLTVFKGEYLYPTQSQAFSSESTFIIVTVVLLILLLLALITSTALGVRYYKLLARTGMWSWAVPAGPSPTAAQPGSPGSRESSQDDSKGSGYINLDVQSHPSPEDPLYCNVEPSQAPRNPPCVEYAVIAFSQSPRSGRE
ncbi:CLM7 protein, partial [Cercotrichas coryphoeus]|nr:CLM7 protein [Cercotrichas coryphoeus]